MRTIAIANQKGGCGKTTTVVNLAAALAQKGKRVLMVDLDPQAHATLGLGHDPDSLDTTIYDVLAGAQTHISAAIMSTNVEGLDLAPSNIFLSGAELELTSVPQREFVLSEALKAVADDYNICIIDCSPSLSLLTVNALIASTDVIIPVQTHYYALEGLSELLKTLQIIKERFNHSSKILGVLLTFVESRTNLSRQVEEQMREFFGGLIFDMVIHRTVRLAEAPSAGQSVLNYAPESRGAMEYKILADEISNRLRRVKNKKKNKSSDRALAEEVSNAQI